MISENDTPTVQPAEIDLLIVDDETDFRESTRRYFFKIGFRVDDAEDGEETFHRYKTKTARALGVSRRSLYRLLDKYKIN